MKKKDRNGVLLSEWFREEEKRAPGFRNYLREAQAREMAKRVKARKGKRGSVE